MYSITAKSNGAYAIIDDQTGQVEALLAKDIEFLLHLGVSIQGVTLNENGDANFDSSIEEFDFSSVDENDDESYEDYYEDDSELYEDSDESYEDSDESYEESYEESYDEEEYYEEDEYTEEEQVYDEVDESEYEAYEEYYDSNISMLYSFLTEEQVKLLKRYYLWYSRRIFTDAEKNPTFGFKSQKAIQRKKQKLDQLRSKGGMWEYAGFIDLGYEGGFCTLGHPLRYMHIAWDVTQGDVEDVFFGDEYTNDVESLLDSNNCIIFGIKCIADFFEVSQECVASLQKAQRESIKDMEEMLGYYRSEQVNEVLQSFNIMDDIMTAVKVVDAKGLLFDGDDYDFTVPNFDTAFYWQFRKAGLIPPRSLVMEIRDALVGWSVHRYTGGLKASNSRVINKNLKRLVSQEYKADVDFLYEHTDYPGTNIRELIDYWLILQTCGVYQYDAETNKSEGGASKSAKLILTNLIHAVKRWVDINDFHLTVKEDCGKLCRIFRLLCEEREMLRDMDTLYTEKLNKDGIKCFAVGRYSWSSWRYSTSWININDIDMCLQTVQNDRLEVDKLVAEYQALRQRIETDVVGVLADYIRPELETAGIESFDYDSGYDVISRVSEESKFLSEISRENNVDRDEILDRIWGKQEESPVEPDISTVEPDVSHMAETNNQSIEFDKSDMRADEPIKQGVVTEVESLNRPSEVIEGVDIYTVDIVTLEELYKRAKGFSNKSKIRARIKELHNGAVPYKNTTTVQVSSNQGGASDGVSQGIVTNTPVFTNQEDVTGVTSQTTAVPTRITKSDILNFIQSNNIPDSDASFEASVARTVREKGTISDKQLIYVENYYRKVNNMPAIEVQRYKLVDNEGYRMAVDWILHESDKAKTIEAKICKTVQRMGTYTDKQKKYLDNALQMYQEAVNV